MARPARAVRRPQRGPCAEQPPSHLLTDGNPQAKALKSYKRHTLAVQSFDDALLPASFQAVESQASLSRLREWSSACRVKWGLTERVVVHRREHHQQFYAGGDWGHCLFVELM